MHHDIIHEKKLLNHYKSNLYDSENYNQNVVKTEDRTDTYRCRGWYKNRTNHVHSDPPFFFEATGETHCTVDYKGSCNLTVNSFISATRRL